MGHVVYVRDRNDPPGYKAAAGRLYTEKVELLEKCLNEKADGGLQAQFKEFTDKLTARFDAIADNFGRRLDRLERAAIEDHHAEVEGEIQVGGR